MYGTWHSYSIYLNSYSLYQYLYRYRYIPKIRTVYTYTGIGIYLKFVQSIPIPTQV